MRVVNRTRENVLGEKVRMADTFLSRFVGLLGTAAIREGEGLWIVPCRSLHTLGMRHLAWRPAGVRRGRTGLTPPACGCYIVL